MTSGQLKSADPRSIAPTADQLARRALLAFLMTFILARTVVLLIMRRRIPTLYLSLRDTHVHHLNYGIFLLAGVGAYLLFRAPTGNSARRAAFAYGIALALTFDEFGMWLHLGGSYWPRASLEAVIVLLGVFGILAVLPQWQRIRAHHYLVGGALLASV